MNQMAFTGPRESETRDLLGNPAFIAALRNNPLLFAATNVHGGPQNGHLSVRAPMIEIFNIVHKVLGVEFGPVHTAIGAAKAVGHYADFVLQSRVSTDEAAFMSDLRSVIRYHAMNNEYWMGQIEGDQVTGLPELTHGDPINVVIERANGVHGHLDIPTECVLQGLASGLGIYSAFAAKECMELKARTTFSQAGFVDLICQTVGDRFMSLRYPKPTALN